MSLKESGKSLATYKSGMPFLLYRCVVCNFWSNISPTSLFRVAFKASFLKRFPLPYIYLHTPSRVLILNQIDRICKGRKKKDAFGIAKNSAS